MIRGRVNRLAPAAFDRSPAGKRWTCVVCGRAMRKSRRSNICADCRKAQADQRER